MRIIMLRESASRQLSMVRRLQGVYCIKSLHCFGVEIYHHAQCPHHDFLASNQCWYIYFTYKTSTYDRPLLSESSCSSASTSSSICLAIILSSSSSASRISLIRRLFLSILFFPRRSRGAFFSLALIPPGPMT